LCFAYINMEHKGIFIGSGALLVVLGLGYLVWRHELRRFTETIEAGDFEEANSLAEGLLDAGELGREVAAPAGLLVFCLLGIWLTSRGQSPSSFAAPEAFGFGSYL
jgi:hypothetical protein